MTIARELSGLEKELFEEIVSEFPTYDNMGEACSLKLYLLRECLTELYKHGEAVIYGMVNLRQEFGSKVRDLRHAHIYNKDWIEHKISGILGFLDVGQYDIVTDILKDMPYEQELQGRAHELVQLSSDTKKLRHCIDVFSGYIQIFSLVPKASIDPDTNMPDYAMFRQRFEKGFLEPVKISEGVIPRKTYLVLLTNFSETCNMAIAIMEGISHPENQNAVSRNQWKDRLQSFSDYVLDSDIVSIAKDVVEARRQQEAARHEKRRVI